MTSSGRQAPKKPQRRFQFIDNSNVSSSNANSTQVRRHVMQEYMREKRWESRARAEGDVLEFATHPQQHIHHQATRSPPRRQPSKSRTKSHAATSAIVETTVEGSSTTPTDSDKLQPHLRRFQPVFQANQLSTLMQDEVIEEVSRKSLPLVQSRHKKPRRGFYLTPQSFASIADLSDVAPSPPTSITTSEKSSSPISLTSPYSAPASLVSHGSSLSPDPMSVLSAARTDPFDSLPLALTKQDQELFDFYATVMPACSYGFERRNPRAHNWYLSVFIPEAMKSPVAFQNTILVHAANTQAWVLGLAETELAIEHRARASQMLSEHFQRYPYDTSDAAISSTLSAAALEDFDPRLERRKYAWIHWNAALQKIRDRGGPSAIEQNKSLRMLINWSDYIFSGYNSHGSTFFFEHSFTPLHSNKAEAEKIARDELSKQCEEFLVFLKCAESLALVASNMQTIPTVRDRQPMRYSLFVSRQPLYNLLASSNGPRYTKTGQLKQIISRLASLMTINVAVWEYRYSTAASEEFFRELTANIKNNDLDQHVSVEALLQILLSGSENASLIHTERPWLVGRLLKVAKRLSRKSWERLNEFLLQCLTLGPTLRPVMENWEKELREEILSAPLISFVLPLMQPS